jgi:hypothetical protein
MRFDRTCGDYWVARALSDEDGRKRPFARAMTPDN